MSGLDEPEKTLAKARRSMVEVTAHLQVFPIRERNHRERLARFAFVFAAGLSCVIGSMAAADSDSAGAGSPTREAIRLYLVSDPGPRPTCFGCLGEWMVMASVAFEAGRVRVLSPEEFPGRGMSRPVMLCNQGGEPIGKATLRQCRPRLAESDEEDWDQYLEEEWPWDCQVEIDSLRTPFVVSSATWLLAVNRLPRAPAGAPAGSPPQVIGLRELTEFLGERLPRPAGADGKGYPALLFHGGTLAVLEVREDEYISEYFIVDKRKGALRASKLPAQDDPLGEFAGAFDLTEDGIPEVIFFAGRVVNADTQILAIFSNVRGNWTRIYDEGIPNP